MEDVVKVGDQEQKVDVQRPKGEPHQSFLFRKSSRVNINF